MAADLLFHGVLPRRKRIFNLNDNLLDGLSEAEVISHATDFCVIAFNLSPTRSLPISKDHVRKIFNIYLTLK